MKNKNSLTNYIQSYINFNPNLGYNNIIKIFNLTIYDLLEILNHKNYSIKNDFLNIYDDNGNLIYEECLSKYDTNTPWKRYVYNNGNLVSQIDSYGYIYNFEYDKRGNQILVADNFGYYKIKYFDETDSLIYQKDSYGNEEHFLN